MLKKVSEELRCGYLGIALEHSGSGPGRRSAAAGQFDVLRIGQALLQAESKESCLFLCS